MRVDRVFKSGQAEHGNELFADIYEMSPGQEQHGVKG